MRRWWLVIALLLSIGMNVGLLAAMVLNGPGASGRQQAALRPAAPGRLQQLANRLGLRGEMRRGFVERQRQFFAETAGPRARLPQLRRQVRAELTGPRPDRAEIDRLLRESAGLYLQLERSVVANVLDSRAVLGPAEERRYVELIGRLQLEGPGQLGRLPQAQWPWWWRFRRPPTAAPPAGAPLSPLDRDRPGELGTAGPAGRLP